MQFNYLKVSNSIKIVTSNMASYFVFTRALLNVFILFHSQKQPSKVFCKKRCSQKLHKIYRKAPVPESLFLIKLQAYFIFCTVGFLIISGGIEDNVFKSRIIRNKIQRPSLSHLTRNLEIEETRFQFSLLSPEQVVQTFQSLMWVC